MKVKMLKYYNVDEKIFAYMIMFMFCISVISIIGNVAIGLEPVVNLKWIALIIMCVFTMIAVLKKKNLIKYQSTMFFIIIFVFLPSGWITSGGINEFTTAYTILICLVLCLMLKGKVRLFFLVSEVLVVTGMIILEYYHPEILYESTRGASFLDRLIQIPMTMIVLAVLVIIFSNFHRKEKNLIEEHIEEIKRLNSVINKISTTDSLTGISNKIGIDKKLNSIRNGVLKDDNTLVMMLSLDGFGDEIIDKGYVACNEVLKDIGKVMKDVVQKKGFVGRYFCDEFIIILEDAQLDEVERFAFEIEHKISNDAYMAKTSIIRMDRGDSTEDVINKLEKIIREAN